jgi:hypothetical protein
MGRDSVVGIATPSWMVQGSNAGGDFFAHVQNGSAAHPAYYTLGNPSLFWA